jgi:NAD(P)H dehydrogenase (quinone)
VSDLNCESSANLGVSVRDADYSKPETLDRALAGIDTLLLISSSEVGQRRAAQHHNVIEAAKRTGVKRIVYTSLLHADTSPLNLADEHRATEAELRVSGIPFTILRNGWYTETTPPPSRVRWQVVLSLVAPATARSRPPFVSTMPRRPSPY